METLREIVGGKLATDPFFTGYKSTDPSEPPPDPTDFSLSYTDAVGNMDTKVAGDISTMDSTTRYVKTFPTVPN